MVHKFKTGLKAQGKYLLFDGIDIKDQKQIHLRAIQVEKSFLNFQGTREANSCVDGFKQDMVINTNG